MLRWSSDQMAQIRDALQAKGVPKSCPGCEQRAGITIGTSYAAVPASATSKSTPVHAPFWPAVAVFCNNCGYTWLFNVRALDLPDLVAETEADG
jgi:hypothetical protein